MKSVVESLLGNARCEESLFGRVAAAINEANNAIARQNCAIMRRTKLKFLKKWENCAMVLREQKSTLNKSNKCQCVAAYKQSDELEGLQ